MMLDISNLQKKVDALVLIIDAGSKPLVLHSTPVGDGTPYISFEDDKYNYIYSERGCELSRKVTESESEVLYWIMYDFVHEIAVQYELTNRISGKDSRRIYFPKIIELMSKMSDVWGVEAKKHLDRTLAVSPYDDTLYS